MRWEFGRYTINTDKSLISADRVKEFLSDSYWARDRSKELIEKTIENSFCYGVYHEEELVGFARVVTDYSTIVWISDVYIDRIHREKGLGKKIIACILETPEFKNVRSALVTRDAHGLYEQFGFESVESIFMVRKPTE
ncbi:sortase-like acyltransferase [Desulfitobacterium dehalogenans ATCC 51507]|uniref:Sortase-like acyltransferase n=1 Tax=Desulfitobacterium dehalogenans (strain ATCC 51507 / DSM 9161 / JW/IU-DC1) TaxID=756499 RepID=I4A5V4_DESDJ|nr:GNAT family N-acetyltransferase [Desulfitobacterium dehalogenans]AFL99338.1 sortase-like acyltransferase [Desulfitobacterium dehalogenans ATCC 51507]